MPNPENNNKIQSQAKSKRIAEGTFNLTTRLIALINKILETRRCSVSW